MSSTFGSESNSCWKLFNVFHLSYFLSYSLLLPASPILPPSQHARHFRATFNVNAIRDTYTYLRLCMVQSLQFNVFYKSWILNITTTLDVLVVCARARVFFAPRVSYVNFPKFIHYVQLWCYCATRLLFMYLSKHATSSESGEERELRSRLCCCCRHWKLRWELFPFVFRFGKEQENKTSHIFGISCKTWESTYVSEFSRFF